MYIKRILVGLVLALSLVSCEKRGEMRLPPQDFIKIHNKVYKLALITPCDDCRAIWIMYPKDSTDAQPQVLNYSVQSGKTSYNQAVIKID